MKFLDDISNGVEGSSPQSSSLQGYTQSNPYSAKLTRNERVTHPDHFQDTRLIEFDLGQSGITYSPGKLNSCFLIYKIIHDCLFPGDVCYVLPENLSESVSSFYELFPQLRDIKDKLFNLEATDKDIALPNMDFPTTIDNCVKKYWDLQVQSTLRDQLD